jgi:hypothetical protein
MKVIINDNQNYDTGIHTDVTEIKFERNIVGDFFNDDRFPNLIYVNCSENKITELKLNCLSLLKLKCSNNFLTELKLNCPLLLELNCCANYLVELKLNCPFLKKLDCAGNKLRILDLNCSYDMENETGGRISGDFLQVIRISSNMLSSLQLFCPSLLDLFCAENKLTKLEIKCSTLRVLCCDYNKLNEIILICPSLIDLNCSGNLLVNLDLFCPSLEILSCIDNPLTNLNGIEICSKLSNLNCPSHLNESVRILKEFIPDLKIKYYQKN